MDTLIPPAVADIFADPPLVRGENADAYLRMIAQLGAECGASAAADWLPVKDVADLTWQIARVRRWVSAFTQSGEREGLESAMLDLFPSGRIGELRFAEALGESEDPAECDEGRRKLLKGYGLPDHVGSAHAFFQHLRSVAEAEGLQMRLEARRDRALAQIEARRREFGAALRAASNRVEDAVKPALVEGPPTAPVEAPEAEDA